MRQLNKFILSVTVFFAIASFVGTPNLYSQSKGQYGTSMNLSLGAGARALGMGRAYTAIANDPTAVFWNPAGLQLVPRMSFTLFHNQLFEGSIYDFIGFVYPTLTYGTVGVGFARLGTNDVPIVSDLNERQGMANYEEDELYISYGNKLPYDLFGGFTFKIRRQQFSLINTNATGLGLDLGLMYRPYFENPVLQNVGFGLTYRNFVSPSLKLGSVSESEPYNMNFGLFKSFEINESGRMLVSLDYHKNGLQTGSISAGTEYAFQELGTVRLGFDNSHLAFGAGIHYSVMEIDYSFGSMGDNGAFPGTHRFSLTFNLGKTRQELIQISEKERKERESRLVAQTREEERQQFIAASMKRGKDYLEKQQYFDAYVEFQQVISADPFNQTAHALLDSADHMIKADLDKRQQEAINNAVNKEIAEENRNFVDLHLQKGRVYLEKNQFTDALMEFNLALEREPDNTVFQDAIATTKRRLEEQVRNLVSQGRAQFQNGNYANALQILSEALVLAPESPQLKEEINTLANRIKVQQNVQQGLQLFDLGDYQQALSVFEEALKMDPSNQQLRQYIERTKRGMGVVEKEMDQESEKQYLKGVNLYLAQKYQEAISVWKELQKNYPYSKRLQDAIKSAEDRMKRTKEGENR